MRLDFGRTVRDYSRYRPGFPPVFFERLSQRGIIKAGMRVVDLGTGTGTIARGLARLGCDVVAVDESAEMLVEARRLDREAGVTVDYVNAVAESTALRDGGFDLVTAGQCWDWFDRDKVLSEVARLLKRGGWLVIAHFDWVSLPGDVVQATEQLIRWYNPDRRLHENYGLHPQWLSDIAKAEFSDVETFSFDMPCLYSHKEWRGRVRASSAVGAYLSPEQLTEFDTDLKKLLVIQYPKEPLEVQHRVFALTCRVS